MINNEDTLLLTYLLKAMTARHKIMWGGDKNTRTPTNFGKYDKRHKIKRAFTGAGDINVNSADNRKHMAKFLRQMGANNDKINEAIHNIEAGKTQISDKSFSWITPESLQEMSNEEFRETMKEMRVEREKSSNFNVSDSTLRRRR